MATKNNRSWRVDLENSSFHDIVCHQRNKVLTSNQFEINFCCEKLKYNTEIDKIVKRSHDASSAKHTNHTFMPYNHLKAELDQYREKTQQLKMNELNHIRDKLSLINRQGDFKRLLTVLANNEIARVRQVLNSCIKSNCSIKNTIETLFQAINGKTDYIYIKYKHKQKLKQILSIYQAVSKLNAMTKKTSIWLV